ncbi:MAG TPA: RluA family pseudouridine synthase [Syntrophorhabdaceae bacterium]|nr:RluA family pseudouridine synthase [Syntrophorhabdaceae bacterium]HOD74377.1 RluA family pseudouridine synthase [Syntrophorhabdaceae bacterium]
MTDSFRIVCDVSDVRLDVFLSEKLSLTRTKVKEMIDGGHVSVDGRTPKPAMRLKERMEIAGEVPRETALDVAPEEIALDILYEDDHFLAVNKPAGMVVHPSFGHSSGTLVNAVLGYLERLGSRFKVQGSREQEPCSESDMAGVRPGIVHRLDKGTTGVILVARDERTQERLSVLFKDRKVRKTYRAVVEGTPGPDSWTVEGNIGRHPVERKKMAVLRSGGRQAQTSFKVLERLEGFSYVEAYPTTGRTHQIRVHLNHAGYPIVGDETYGRRAKRSAARPLLHAWRIEFIHPATLKPVAIEAPVPADMIDFVEKHRGQLH